MIITGQILNETRISGAILNQILISGQLGVPKPVAADSMLLLETGGTDNLLLETGDDLLLE